MCTKRDEHIHCDAYGGGTATETSVDTCALSVTNTFTGRYMCKKRNEHSHRDANGGASAADTDVDTCAVSVTNTFTVMPMASNVSGA